MVPHKTARDDEVMNMLRVFDGISAPYDKVSIVFRKFVQICVVQQQKITIVPSALRVLTKMVKMIADIICLSHEVGWKYQVGVI